MYKCKCWNEENFKEVYQVQTIVKINDWEFSNSYDDQNDLIEVICLDCWDNKEDWSVLCYNWEKIVIN